LFARNEGRENSARVEGFFVSGGSHPEPSSE
jgi:hypothetical protein